MKMSEETIDRIHRTEVTPFSTAVLVLGILSIPTCICYGVVGLAIGITALALATKGKRLYNQHPDKYTQASYKNLSAGKTCAIIGVCLSALWFLYFIIIMGVAITPLNNLAF